MRNILISSGLALVLLLSTGCAPRGIQQSNVGQQMNVEPGIVQSVKQVVINNKGVGNTIGGVLGAVAGGIGGNHVGGGTGNTIATIAGTALGGVLGGMAGDKMDTNYGMEVVVKLNSGRSIGTVLPLNEATTPLGVGQAVNVFMSNNGTISNISPR